MNTVIGPVRFGGSGFAATAFSIPGKRAVSFFTSAGAVAGATATALAGSAGFSTAFSTVSGSSALTSTDFAVISVFAASACAGAWASSIFLLPLSIAPVSAGLTSPASDDLISDAASAGLLSGEEVSARTASISDFGCSDFAASDFASVLDASSVLTEAGSLGAGCARPSEFAASDIVTAALVDGMAALASAVWVCSRNGIDAA